MKKLVLLLTMVLVFLPLGGAAQSPQKVPWLHLEVKENKEEPELVKVNLPMSMVEVALNVVKDKDFNKGRIKLETQDVSVADLKKLWSEFKKAGNAEFLTVEKKTESVRISREGNFLLVKVFDQKNTKVDIKIPVTVVDAMLSSPGNELDIKAALLAMQQHGVGEILTVNDHDSHVRIWID